MQYQETACISWQCDTFKLDNALVYHNLLKIFIDTDACMYMTHRKSKYNGWAAFFDINKQFLCIDCVARQAPEAEQKLQNSHYNGEKKGHGWDIYVALHKEQHIIMERIAVLLMIVLRSAKFCKELILLSWRQQSILSGPNKRSMTKILMPPCLIWVKWSWNCLQYAICPCCKDWKSASKS